MSKFEELKKKVKDQIFCGIAKGEAKENMLRFEIGGASFLCNKLSEDSYIEHAINVLDRNWEEKHATTNRNAKPKAIFEYRVPDEVDELIESRSNGTYSDISDTASEIIKALGTDSEYTYFFTQIANKLARIKNGYSVEDSLLDIAGYAKLELEKERKNERL